MLSSAGKAPSVIYSLLLWRRIQAQACYYRDQTPEPSHIPCNASAPVSLCCASGSTCLTSGLCFYRYDVSINTGTCTDKTWSSPGCFQQCPESLGNDHGYHTLYRCSDNLWCCSTGGNTTSCCDDGGVKSLTLSNDGVVMGGTGFVPGFTIAPVEVLQTSMSTAPSSASATSNAIDVVPTKSQSSAAAIKTTDTQTPYQEHNTSVSDATKTGLGAGLGVGLPLLAGLTAALLYLRRLRLQGNSQKKKREKRTACGIDDAELLAHHARQEMESIPGEMPDSRRDTAQEIGVRA